MTSRNLLAAAAMSLALTLSHPASAFEADPFARLESINPEVLFKGIIREDDVTLVFKHVRESMAAAARGEEAQESEAMKRRAQQIQREVAVRGSVLMEVLLSAFESAAKQMVRDSLSEFGSSPSRGAPYPRSSSKD